MINHNKNNKKELFMDDKEIKIERWSVCERYKNYKSNNYYKDPVQFRPHPESVVRDVIMYHIYHNEGMQCNNDLVQYIKNKTIYDLNEIFMLYKYAPDAISTINRLMSSKRHLSTEDTYNETIFHALTIKDARDVLIEQISNVLIKCIPEPLGNIKFNVIMKDEIMNNNTKESSTDAEDKPFDFAVKSVSGKLYNHVYKIVDDLIGKSCDRVTDMITNSRTFRMSPEIDHDKYKILLLSKTIGYALHLSFGINRGTAWNETREVLLYKFQFKHYFDPMVNQAFIKHMTDFVCRNLSFDKSMELEKEVVEHEQEIETVKSDVKESDHHDKVQEKLIDNNPQRFQVGDLVSFEEDRWYYQSLIYGVCYHKESKLWSYVIVAFDEFRRISGGEVDRLTLLKKIENI